MQVVDMREEGLVVIAIRDQVQALAERVRSAADALQRAALGTELSTLRKELEVLETAGWLCRWTGRRGRCWCCMDAAL